jgi:hypothetical protein
MNVKGFPRLVVLGLLPLMVGIVPLLPISGQAQDGTPTGGATPGPSAEGTRRRVENRDQSLSQDLGVSPLREPSIDQE